MAATVYPGKNFLPWVTYFNSESLQILSRHLAWHHYVWVTLAMYNIWFVVMKFGKETWKWDDLCRHGIFTCWLQSIVTFSIMRQVFSDLFESICLKVVYHTIYTQWVQFCPSLEEILCLISDFMIYFLSKLDERERLQSNSLFRCRNKLYEVVIISMDNFYLPVFHFIIKQINFSLYKVSTTFWFFR